MTTANIIAWLVIGGVIGFLVFTFLHRSESFGSMFIDVLVGAIGGLIGGILLNSTGGIVGSEVIGVNLGGAGVALIGAAILVGLVEWIRGSQVR